MNGAEDTRWPRIGADTTRLSAQRCNGCRKKRASPLQPGDSRTRPPDTRRWRGEAFFGTGEAHALGADRGIVRLRFGREGPCVLGIIRFSRWRCARRSSWRHWRSVWVRPTRRSGRTTTWAAPQATYWPMTGAHRMPTPVPAAGVYFGRVFDNQFGFEVHVSGDGFEIGTDLGSDLYRYLFGADAIYNSVIVAAGALLRLSAGAAPTTTWCLRRKTPWTSSPMRPLAWYRQPLPTSVSCVCARKRAMCMTSSAMASVTCA